MNKIEVSASKKEGSPWTQAIAAIYRVEVDSAPMVATDLFPVCLP